MLLIYDLQGGKGLHSTLNFHSKKFVGILNGIDTDAWNPATDTFLKVQYTANDLQGKAENKEAMRRHLRLSSADVRKPLVILFYQMVYFVMRRHHHITEVFRFVNILNAALI